MFSKAFQEKYIQEISQRSMRKRDIRRAYETAHRIREFEIDLYWKRTAYIWAMQAALIGVVMFLRTGGMMTVSVGFLSLTARTKPTVSLLISIILLSTLAITIACLWYLLIKGAKFWQNNWERHVDILGEKLGENLYQVYPVHRQKKDLSSEDFKPPFSVTKINSYIVCSFIWFWLFNLAWALWDLSIIVAINGGWAFLLVLSFWIVLYVLMVLFFCIQFKNSKAYSGLRMSGFGNPVVYCSTKNYESALYSRRIDRF